ncbi:amino acid transporter [Pleomassaria siparia CBS 279.74]|uniref:Amino acid transporter n=1 Tax=Pleomassaria siparia CBS 279.74 TaxID=1314801 RepID=A0A6G1K5J8_9PLEO|nr:amino acid transporter [Pleomassaria siparia CBS 279.74]
MAPAPTEPRRRSVAEEPVTSILPGGDVPFDPSHEFSADEEALAALGYKSEFKREFSLFTTFCVSFAVLGLLPSFASTLYYGMGYAGTAGMTWGWVVAMIGIQCVAMSMAELCSSMPTSGGLYYAAAVLAPPGWGPFAAWITGWSNWLAQVTAAPSVNYGISAMCLAAASIVNPDYVPTDYQTFLLTVLMMLIHGVMSSLPTRWLAQINSAGSTFNMVALIIVIILIPAGTDRESRGLPKFTPSSEVWGTIYEGTAFPPGISVLMSFIGVIWTMSGYDSPFHLAEECSNASIASPRAIVMTSATGGIFGWFLQLVVAYTVVDIDQVLDSDLGQPFAAYLMQCMPQKITLAILSLTIIAGFSMGQGCMIAASRVTFAYARDDCFPLSKYWKVVNARTQTPVNAVWFNCIIGILLLLLIFGGSIAVGALFSIGAIGAFVAFTLPIFIRVFFVGDRFRAGPWHLGKFSIPIGVVASAFVALMVPILCLPSVTGADLTLDTMNWTALVYGAPMLLVTIWWFISAHKWFKGPKVNVEHAMLGREGNAIDGKGEQGRDSGSDALAPVTSIDKKILT